MPKYKITKRRVRTFRDGKLYRTGSPIELSVEEAEDKEDEWGLVPAKETSKELEEAPRFDVEQARAVLERDNYNEMVAFVAGHSAEPLGSRKADAVRARLQELIDAAA